MPKWANLINVPVRYVGPFALKVVLSRVHPTLTCTSYILKICAHEHTKGPFQVAPHALHLMNVQIIIIKDRVKISKELRDVNGSTVGET